MKRLVFVVLVAVSATWAGDVEPPPGPVFGLDPSAVTGNDTHISKISEGETSIGERGGKSGKPSPCCTRAGGFCVRKSATCNGTVDRQGCRGGAWKCCMPCVLPDCSPKPCCSFAGGHCIKDASHCPYGVIDRRGCKGPGCMCCLPSSFGLPWVYLNYSLTVYGSGGDAFVPFDDIRTDWYTAQCICRNYGLNLYHPDNILAVHYYLRDYTASQHYWIGAKGVGDAQNWLNGDVLTNASTPWYPGSYHTGINCCVYMAAATGHRYVATWPNNQDICKNYAISPLCG